EIVIDGVLVEALRRVVDADHEERRQAAGGNEAVGDAAGVPGDAKGGQGGVEEALAGVQVDDGGTALGVLVVAGRQVDDEGTGVAEELAGERGVEAEFAFAGRRQTFAARVGHRKAITTKTQRAQREAKEIDRECQGLTAQIRGYSRWFSLC